MRISRFLSYILHPIFMPLLALYIILNYIDFFTILFFSYTKPLYLIVSVFTLVLPLIFVLISLKFNTISSLEMSTKEERNRPLFYTIIIFKTDLIANKYASGFVIFAILILAYILFSELGPDARESITTLRMQVVAQKSILFCFIIAVYIQTQGLKLILDN